MNPSQGLLGSIWHHSIQSIRGLRYKASARKYPTVFVDDVVLDKPRYGFRKERQPLLSQSVTDSVFPAEEIRKLYIEQDKPVPIKFRSRSDKIARRNLEKYADEIASGEAHFKLGQKQVYLPKARIALLRSNAKHTPYQAKFLVPRNFNKLDLRDYLWHVYGLRALNITVQLLHAKFERSMTDMGRYRGPQYKKMTIDMEEPFVWPQLPAEAKSFSETIENQTDIIEIKNSLGSDKDKQTNAFDGLYKKPVLPNKFITKSFKQEAEKKMNKYNETVTLKSNKDLVNQFLGY
ncbi:hypothetical protein CANTEDRAFT_101102 [Yamadazyma tenuis ATCC 10573]|uniref:Large ribosomal subunit protein uL23m n=1 Tax=Candida tenuis (strain ATCC 10573 / BCRC 21748 / CBS 615 / JCM 9827 / NBRC 10315 / NRRL Y-1498 / VKM Y-70) TaxID=590646 RepID=G3AW39_CANTC|nr:uncharacterized protein CANTEDRAFT_101102 [Yamadazyma tenuis ATCC 10573]EGV66443.1 hypothetical protein CANTEDRAFT_101102 [Yamadazyma tenuis ATCC 10573]